MSEDSSSSQSSDGGSGGGDIPYHLMPVAAILGMYAAFATIRALYQIYRNIGHDPSKVTADMKLKGQIPKPIKSRQFALLIVSIVVAIVGYGYVTALVDNSIAASDIFDPYDILQISTSAARVEIKQAYRSLSKTHHPDKGGDADIFHKINLAYRALSDETSRANFEKYGHPDGPQTRTLSFAMPDWLLHPTGNVALVLVLLYLGAFVGLVVWVVRYMTRTEAAHAKKALETSVAGADAAYIATNLRPESTHLEVLFYIATTPENLAISQADIARADELRAKRKEFLAKQNEGKNETSGGLDELDLDAGGWADDDEEEDEEVKRRAELAKQAEEEKAKEAKRLAAATGKANSAENVKLEGIDEGVLGQQWVENTLKKAGKWPPELGSLAKRTFANEKGKAVGPLDNRAVRRNICMTMGRLNAQMLNTHQELLSAGAKGLIDPTYFKSTMEFRQRTGLLLEAALRVAMSARSYRLAKTVVETVSMFKIGTMSHDDKKTLEWFKDTMIKQYGGEEGIPRLELLSKDIETPDEDEIATGDTCALIMEIGRKHADSFTQQKLELCRKQGIPPQVAMQTYREGWWILIRAKKIGGGGSDASGDGVDTNNPLSQMLDDEARKLFVNEKNENRLSCAWPFIVSNVAQKQGKVKVQFKAPSAPGEYQFLVSVKSQEFLGADQEFVVEKEVIDGEELALKQRGEEDDEEDEEDVDEETKKTK